MAVYLGQNCSPGFRLSFAFGLALWKSNRDRAVHLDFVYCYIQVSFVAI